MKGEAYVEWVDKMNRVIDYVENQLRNEINTEEIAGIMACPFEVFQRFFVQITGLPLSEYIRRRKLTCAAYELKNTNEKVIDIALKYGYESADAFSVAFKRMHGVAPNMARKLETNLKFFSRLNFTLVIKGVFEMNYQVAEKKSFKVVGKRLVTPEGGGTWAICKADGSLTTIQGFGEKGQVTLGLCFGFDGDGKNDYMVGIECAEDHAGFDSYAYPDSHWLVFTAAGKISDNVLGNTWKRIYEEFLPQSKYKQAVYPTIESYKVWDMESDACEVEIMIPVEA
jgi:AraC family transcriptional regulator